MSWRRPGKRMSRTLHSIEQVLNGRGWVILKKHRAKYSNSCYLYVVHIPRRALRILRVSDHGVHAKTGPIDVSIDPETGGLKTVDWDAVLSDIPSAGFGRR